MFIEEFYLGVLAQQPTDLLVLVTLLAAIFCAVLQNVIEPNKLCDSHSKEGSNMVIAKQVFANVFKGVLIVAASVLVNMVSANSLASALGALIPSANQIKFTKLQQGASY